MPRPDRSRAALIDTAALLFRRQGYAATGVNQILEAADVKAGSLYLAHLLRETNGDPALAAASYYQGLASVRRIGMLPETQRYVANVLALRGRFGG